MWWRSVYASTQRLWLMKAFMNEMAALAGRTSLILRRRYLKVTVPALINKWKKFGWKSRKKAMVWRSNHKKCFYQHCWAGG